MSNGEATFHIGDTVVYGMQGTGRVHNTLTRTIEGVPRHLYEIVLEKNKGEVLVPLAEATALGLRHALRASEVPQVLRRLQQEASRSLQRGQGEDHYTWCKRRLREGGILGLAEVRRFLHDLEQVESLVHPRLRQLRAYVYAQLPAEMAPALQCALTTAERLIDTALTSTHPVALPTAAPQHAREREPGTQQPTAATAQQPTRAETEPVG
jgi:CarD family transcriptional regulator